MIVGVEKPPLAELQHFGVKGMKWGVRRSAQATNASYTPQMQSADRKLHGKRAVSRINARLNNGETRKDALVREDIRNDRQRLLAVGGIYAASVLASHGSVTIASKAANNRMAAKTIGIGSKAAKLNYANTRRGIYNITTMK